MVQAGSKQRAARSGKWMQRFQVWLGSSVDRGCSPLLLSSPLGSWTSFSVQIRSNWMSKIKLEMAGLDSRRCHKLLIPSQGRVYRIECDDRDRHVVLLRSAVLLMSALAPFRVAAGPCGHFPTKFSSQLKSGHHPRSRHPTSSPTQLITPASLTTLFAVTVTEG